MWQPIETAPKDGTSILLYVDGCVIEGNYRGSEDYKYWGYVSLNSHGCGCCGEDDPEPTHWMPLPEAPKE